MENSYHKLRVDGRMIYLPEEHLSDYAAIKKVMQGNMGRYVSGKSAFAFDYDPTELLDRLRAGEKVNLKKDFDYFPTPPEVIDRMLNIAMPLANYYERALEPSAGQGAIVDALMDWGYVPPIDCVEIHPINRGKLEDKGYNLVGTDFMEFEPLVKYDLILANPPFKFYREHFMRMWEIVEPDGEICCVAPNSITFAKDKKTVAVRELVEKHGEISTLPSRSFRSSGTGVETVILNVRKPVNWTTGSVQQLDLFTSENQ